jgi:lysophospholipase L1-like esterase
MQRHARALSTVTKWIATVSFTLVLISLMLLLAEGAIRVRQTLKYGSSKTIEDLYTVDPKIELRVPIAGMTSGRITINRLGFRGPEFPVPKPPKTLRLAFLGASTVWCAEVSSNEKVWPNIVTRSLQRFFPGRQIDHINGGVPGYTLRSSQKNLEHRIAPLEPDVIVIYHAANELSGEMRELAVARGLIPNAQLSERSWLANHSLLWNLVEKNLRVIHAQFSARQGVGRLHFDAGDVGVKFRHELTELVNSAKQRAEIVAVATFATQLRPEQRVEERLQAAGSALYYMPFMQPEGLIAGYGRYNQIIREVARDAGIILIDGEETIPGDAAHFADTVHFTDAGSERMAARVTGVLLAHPAFRNLVMN